MKKADIWRTEEDRFSKAVFRPRARILQILGQEMISSDVVAVIELVKNSYDADATRVLVRFQGPLEAGQGSIEIIDNGHGMSLETITEAWMEPATIFRRRRARSVRRSRRVLGEKGIGRFATSRLANNLEIVTRPENSEQEIAVLFDWRQFEDEEKFLDEVGVLWEERKPLEIKPGGTIEVLYEKDDIFPSAEQLTHGTILRMKGLRSAWRENQVEDLRRELSRLVSPFFSHDEVTANDDFQIRLEFPEPFENFSEVIEPPEIIKNPHYMIAGDICEDGCYNLTIRLRGKDEPEEISGKFILTGGRKPECGPFRLEIRVWDREERSLDEIARQHNLTIQDIRETLDYMAGISIYRDGFRVLPYGEPYNDWLRLDLRSRLNPTLRLANNQVIGYVLISADRNPNLRDQSNREGLIKNQALSDLRELIIRVLNELEIRRYQQRPRKSKEKSRAGSLFAGFGLGDLHDLLKKRHPEDTYLMQMVARKERDLADRVREVQEVLSRYHRLATLGQLIDTVLHEGRTPVAKIDNEAYLGLRDINRAQNESKIPVEKLRHRFEIIRGQSGTLATVFRRIEPFGGRKRGKPKSVRLEQVIADAFDLLNSDIKRANVHVELPQTDTWVTVDQAEIQEVIINLLQNSLYWLLQVPKQQRKISVVVSRELSGEVQILFSDSGPGVDPEVRERIFDPYFSTKPDGIGLGLAIAGEIVSEYYDGALELVEGGPLPGATFRIILRRRVLA